MLLLRSFSDSRMTATSAWNRWNLSACRGLGLGKTGSEDRPLFGHAFDQQPAAVAADNVLDQRQAQTGPALRPAVADIDPVKPLGEPRQMFGRDTGTEIAHHDPDFRRALARQRLTERHLDLAAGGAVFQRVLDQVFEQPQQLLAVARDN